MHIHYVPFLKGHAHLPSLFLCLSSCPAPSHAPSSLLLLLSPEAGLTSPLTPLPFAFPQLKTSLPELCHMTSFYRTPLFKNYNNVPFKLHHLCANSLVHEPFLPSQLPMTMQVFVSLPHVPPALLASSVFKRSL